MENRSSATIDETFMQKKKREKLGDFRFLLSTHMYVKSLE